MGLEFWASIATLVLFCAYIFGRIITINIEKGFIYESPQYYFEDEDLSGIAITEEYGSSDNLGGFMLFSSEKALRNVELYKCHISEKGKIVRDDRVFSHGYLNQGSVLKINILPIGLIPHYLLVFQRYDYLKGTLPISENGRNGIASEIITIKHSFLSVIYALVR